jgi:uncharacterized C2H2 Zn-finger protein
MMQEKAHLVPVGSWTKDAQFLFKCSRCELVFALPEDRTPKEAASELWTAFRDHKRKEHPEDVAD